MGYMADWVKELELDNPVILDLGACPFCGKYDVRIAGNGKAVGRKPPVGCCVPGTLMEMARIQKGLRMVRDPQEVAGLRSDLRRVEEALRALRPSREAVMEAARQVMERGYSVELSISGIAEGRR